MAGNVDSYEVFMDAKRTLLLYNKKIEEDLSINKKKRASPKEIDIGTQPLLTPTDPDAEEKAQEQNSEDDTNPGQAGGNGRGNTLSPGY